MFESIIVGFGEVQAVIFALIVLLVGWTLYELHNAAKDEGRGSEE